MGWSPGCSQGAGRWQTWGLQRDICVCSLAHHTGLSLVPLRLDCSGQMRGTWMNQWKECGETPTIIIHLLQTSWDEFGHCLQTTLFPLMVCCKIVHDLNGVMTCANGMFLDVLLKSVNIVQVILKAKSRVLLSGLFLAYLNFCTILPDLCVQYTKPGFWLSSLFSKSCVQIHRFND